jgi:Uma2 family endonuclease
MNAVNHQRRIKNMAAVLETIVQQDKEYEIVNGQLEEKIMGGARHGGVGADLIIELGGYIKSHRLGRVYGPDTSFKIGRNERMPDVAFVAASRIPEEGEPIGAWPIAPDLAVEIISPNDLYESVMTKIMEYFAAGVRQVWIISLEHRLVAVYSSPTESKLLGETDELDGGDIIPGFRLRVADLFQGPARRSESMSQ